MRRLSIEDHFCRRQTAAKAAAWLLTNVALAADARTTDVIMAECMRKFMTNQRHAIVVQVLVFASQVLRNAHPIFGREMNFYMIQATIGNT